MITCFGRSRRCQKQRHQRGRFGSCQEVCVGLARSSSLVTSGHVWRRSPRCTWSGFYGRCSLSSKRFLLQVRSRSWSPIGCSTGWSEKLVSYESMGPPACSEGLFTPVQPGSRRLPVPRFCAIAYQAAAAPARAGCHAMIV